MLNLLGMTRILTPNYSSFQVPEESGGLQVLTPQFIAAARERHPPIVPWTISEEGNLRRMIDLGMDGINTDYPERLLQIMETP